MDRLIYYFKNITTLNKNEYIAFGLTAGLLLFLILSIYFLIDHMVKNKTIEMSLKQLYENTEKDAKSRKKTYEERIEEEGNTEKEDLLTKLDLLIDHSGLKTKIPFLNAEIYLIIGILIMSIGFLIVYEITEVVFYGLSFMVVIVVLGMSILLFLSARNKKKIEANIVNFINLVENYSKTSDDIINIFGKVYPYLDDPLRTDIELCYAEGTSTGNIEKSLEHLSKRVNHKKFREIIRNLSICSRYEANYSDVAEDSRDMLMEYLAGKREREAMVNSARLELAIIIVMCVFMVFLMGSFTEESVITILTQNLLGNVLLIYCLVVVLAAIVNLIVIGASRD